MTGLDRNMPNLFSPRDSGLPPQEFLLTEAQLRSIEIFGEAILNLKGQIDSLLPERSSLFVLFYQMIISIESLLDLPWF